MSLGSNLQFLRRMHYNMTQEELAERMNVSRQTISKWEMDTCFPELDKAIELCSFFSCSLDDLLRNNMDSGNDAYQDMRVEKYASFQYYPYTVVSSEPEDDSIKKVSDWAKKHNIEAPKIIGLDFPFVSQEQVNIYHMHGYTAACIVPEGTTIDDESFLVRQESSYYAVITIKEPFTAPFTIIPNAYKTLIRYMDVNGLKRCEKKGFLPCFECSYEKDGISYMDVYILYEV